MDWFAERLLDWHDVHGRHDLPWQQNKSPYRVWISEIMLQQTQVTTVIPYFQKFMARFPNVKALANADLDEVLHHWTGLGYYARARNMHAAAKEVQQTGAFPDNASDLEALPGIGRTTAAAILAIAFDQPTAILDGNVKRVLCRFHAIEGDPTNKEVEAQLWNQASLHMPDQRTGTYTQAIMDLGATLCKRQPECINCPLVDQCSAFAQGRVADFPARKLKKTKPVRSARLFVITTPDGACLLEQRPPSGIWGSLWTPPQRTTSTSPDEVCLEFGIHFDDVHSSHRAPTFRHTFTHYHLDIEPLYLHLTRHPQMSADHDRLVWYHRGLNQSLGLSAVAVKLLASVDEQFELK
ncbi:MAG: A/G-specific adenine glycosylase [Proteobacteria bacterium]|nr:A/G-specific adenine glycosylase [Pseudomonadota bacterium]